MLQIFLGDEIRGFMVELNEHAYGTGIRFLGAFAFTVELQVLIDFSYQSFIMAILLSYGE